MSIIERIKKNQEYFYLVEFKYKDERTRVEEICNLEIENDSLKYFYFDDYYDDFELNNKGELEQTNYDEDSEPLIITDIKFLGQKAYFPLGSKVKVTDDVEFLKSELLAGGFIEDLDQYEYFGYNKTLGEIFTINLIQDGAYTFKEFSDTLPHSVLELV